MTENQKLLILDLDETLIHSSAQPLKEKESFQVGQYYVYVRPDLEWFLKNISVHYKIGIWSAAEDEYVTAIAKNIIPKEVRLSLLWDRNWCEAVQLKDKIEVVFEKKLTKLSPLNFRMEEIILVEDSHHNASINSGNTIIIPPFRGESNDIYLKLLYDYLISVKEKVFINNGENHFL